MLKRLSLRHFVIVNALEIDFERGFAVLTGETGAGKSILIDALQLALGGRGEAGVVREGEQRADISAEFEPVPASLQGWLDEAGIEPLADNPHALLLRRTVDVQGKSRAWINGIAATVGQLKELSEHLVDIHGQHAWQSLTRPASVRALLDQYAGLSLRETEQAWQVWREAVARLEAAQQQGAERERERERLVWQIGEIDRLAPGEHEWEELNAEHQRLAHAQAILDALRQALEALSDGEANAQGMTGSALDALEEVSSFDAAIPEITSVLHSAQAQLNDAAHSLNALLRRTELDPYRLGELDARLSAWMGLARRFRQPPQDLPALHAQWQAQLRALDEATDTEALQRHVDAARQAYLRAAEQVSAQRQQAAPVLAEAITAAMQTLGMAGGRFEIALERLSEPQSFGLEAIDFRVAGHSGSTPRSLAKVASGGELSRIALAIAVTTSQMRQARGHGADTLIFDEVDSGVGGAVADTVGQLMHRLGQERQVLAVTHLPQVAACADQHLLVSKAPAVDGRTQSDIRTITGEARIGEIARMLGGQHVSGTSLAHAREMLGLSAAPVV